MRIKKIFLRTVLRTTLLAISMLNMAEAMQPQGSKTSLSEAEIEEIIRETDEVVRDSQFSDQEIDWPLSLPLPSSLSSFFV